MEFNDKNLNLKPCTKEDIDKIYALSLANLDRYEKFEDKKRTRVLNVLKENVEKNISNYRKIYKDDKHVGYYLLENKDDNLEIDDLLLLKDDETKNIGQFIVDYWKKLSENYGKPLILNVFKYNIEAINLYFSKGFNVVEVKKDTRVKLGYFSK